MNNPYVELYRVALDILRWVLLTTYRLESWIVYKKIQLVRKIDGQQSDYGW